MTVLFMPNLLDSGLYMVRLIAPIYKKAFKLNTDLEGYISETHNTRYRGTYRGTSLTCEVPHYRGTSLMTSRVQSPKPASPMSF